MTSNQQEQSPTISHGAYDVQDGGLPLIVMAPLLLLRSIAGRIEAEDANDMWWPFAVDLIAGAGLAFWFRLVTFLLSTPAGQAAGPGPREFAAHLTLTVRKRPR